MVGGSVTGLANLRIETEVAYKSLRRRDALDVTDRRQNAHRGGCIHSCDRHQPSDLRILESFLGQALVDLSEFEAKSIQLAGMAQDDPTLILGKREGLQPDPSAFREQAAFIRRD
jgi:hypothetical protein